MCCVIAAHPGVHSAAA